MGGDAVEALSGKNTGKYRTWLIVVLVTVVATGLLLCGGVAAWIGTSALRLGDSNQDVPQGKVADVQGVVRYDGNHMGALRATLEREDGAWRVHGVNIAVPPSKLRDLDLSRRMEQ